MYILYNLFLAHPSLSIPFGELKAKKEEFHSQEESQAGVAGLNPESIPL